MNTIIQILLFIFIALTPSLDTLYPATSQLFRDQAVLLHGQMVHSSWILENGLEKLNRYLEYLEKEEAISADQLADQQKKRERLEIEKEEIDRADEQILRYLEQTAPQKPQTVPELSELQEHTAMKEVSLPWGGAREGENYFRACPPEEIDWTPSQSEKLVLPARGSISAGTWYYPSGKVHLGMDLALNLYTPIRAPADGVILYADAPEDSTSGYPGNWSGWPLGAGNSILMLASTEEEIYAISFFHLSNRIQVRPGQQVRQSEILAYSGNSGNSSGPHLHVEVFRVDTDWQDAVSCFQKTVDFSFQTGWESPGACSEYGCRIRPEKAFDFDD